MLLINATLHPWTSIRIYKVGTKKEGFPGSSAGIGSAHNVEDPSSSPGSGRSAGEGIGCPLQYSWASLVAQLLKNPPVMWETWVQPLGWEDSLKKGVAIYASILAWRVPWTVQSMGLQGVRHDWVTFTLLRKREELSHHLPASKGQTEPGRAFRPSGGRFPVFIHYTWQPFLLCG